MADKQPDLSITQVKAAYQRALTKLARQQSALAATQAEIAVWEQYMRNTEKGR
jgi:hypothetical protein